MHKASDLQKLTRRIQSTLKDEHPGLADDTRQSIAKCAARVSLEWHAEQSLKQEAAPAGTTQTPSDPPPPAVVLAMEQALLAHFPEMPQYAARTLAGDVFDETQELYQWKVRPFPDQHLLPGFMRRGPAPPWPGEAGDSQRLGFRLIRVAR